jgi:LruC domain-containing protein
MRPATRFSHLVTIIFAATLFLLLGGCGGNPFVTPTGPDSTGESSQETSDRGGRGTTDEESGTTFTLPPDSGNETVRTIETFAFETLYPVEFSLTVQLYDPRTYSGEASPEPLPPETAPVHVRLFTRDGGTVYETVLTDERHTEKQIHLPAAKQDIILRLEAPGFEPREITISDMVKYSRVQRTLSMKAVEDSVQAMGTMPDSDGDGVPDAYDAAPHNENTAFVDQVPADGTLTVAYEDLFGRADAGDADYNDFIANYRITEGRSSDGLTSIEVTATAERKLAGYDHRWGIRIDSFTGEATLEGTYVDADGNVVERDPRTVTAPLEVDLFENTGTAEGMTASFKLTFGTDNPQNLDSEAGKVMVDRPPYNPYLYVHDTGHDVHLIGEQALSQSINTQSEFRDAEGFPWALLVPTEWEHPDEGQRIEERYPRFTEWRKSRGQKETDWYIPVGDNQAPYPVSGGITDDMPDTPGIQKRIYYIDQKTFTLDIQQDSRGRRDPDGDDVRFASDPVLGTGNYDEFSLDAKTGKVQFVPSGESDEVTVRFYTVDEHGATSKDEAFVVDFILWAS